MASSGKRKTTMAKLNRERKLIEKRHAKQIRKDARRQAAEEGVSSEEFGAAQFAGSQDALTADER